MRSPQIAPRRPAPVFGYTPRTAVASNSGINDIDATDCLATTGAGLSRRWLGLERRTRIPHRAAPNSKSAAAYRSFSRIYELQMLRQSHLSRPWVVLAPLRLAFTRPIARYGSRSRRGVQRRESCASIRDPGGQCGLHLRVTQSIATAMYFVPAWRLSPHNRGTSRPIPSPSSGILGALCGLGKST